MKNLQNLLDYLTQELNLIYDLSEANSIAWLLVEHELGWNRTQISLRKQEPISPEIWQKFTPYLQRLQNHEPLQYITGYAHFYDLELRVTPDVLIPRPETEELVQLTIQENKSLPDLQILDVGTGSGCIAIALSKNLPQATVYGLDVSEPALAVARGNAEQYQLPIHWLQHDIFTSPLPLPPQSLHVLVSNPPYVLESEKNLMRRNVLDFEPPLALFVPDTDALIYYQRIAEVAQQLLLPAGKLYFEINEKYATALETLLQEYHFQNIRTHTDLFGKDRFVSAAYPDTK
ncbi:peptide chain release factor N(5)-glutamine methyltransferase [Adhaeribacter arboris]|uniref:Release factor glutamine methyltransferase n=1 Tax=Adhaeribacter arboris TaxID=2072846 RepID=A0A2T2YIR8_9BACT|nr:peptide chain release factor N(5)-glutamine methyltransferase [Adhaeribacter arboris]PSR55397.1 peptide chain release factor N(5)-glutamine methyltransferase [Adhaeribacter arboris]